MEKIEAFERIQKLLPKFNEYFETRQLTINQEERIELKEIYEQAIVPGSRVDLSCPPCVKSAIELTESWYSREYPKYLKTLPQIQDAVIVEPVTEVQEQEPVKETVKTIPVKKTNSKRKKKYGREF